MTTSTTRQLKNRLDRRERDLLRPPESITVSEWADRYRELPTTAAEPGRWSTARVPHTQEIANTLLDPDVEETTFQKCTQISGTELLLNLIGYIVDQMPGPTLVVVPKEAAIGVFNFERIKPMFDASARLQTHVLPSRSAWTEKRIRFDSMPLYFASAEVPSDLGSHAIRNLMCDELDKWPPWSGREASPLDLARERVQSYPDSKLFKTSTPILATDLIHTEFLRSDQRHYHVPCPFCGTFQVLVFDNLKVGDERDPETIETKRLARYLCRSCDRLIDESHKQTMLAHGKWVPEGGKINAAGHVTGTSSKHRGYQINSLYSPWARRSWHHVAAEWFRSLKKVGGLQNFNNSWLGQPWIEKTSEVRAGELDACIEDYEEGIVPRAARVITAAVDVQAHGFYVVVRAWAAAYRSWLIRAEYLTTWTEVANLVVHGRFPKGAAGELLPVHLACMDTGYRTDEVYEFCRDYEDVMRPTKGQQHLLSGGFFRAARIERTANGQVFGVVQFQLDNHVLKDKLARLIRGPATAAWRWSIHKNPRPDYMRQLLTEHKAISRNKRTGKVSEEWQKKQEGAANHFWDCEVMALAAAEMLQVYGLPPDDEAPPSAPAPRSARGGDWLPGQGEWLGERREREPRRGGWLEQ